MPRKIANTADESGTKIYRNVTIDSEVQELLNAAQQNLEKEFGFKPSISQTIRFLIKRAAIGGDGK